jgi:hypothetical protein
MTTYILRTRDGKSEVRRFDRTPLDPLGYVPPQILIDGETYYRRITPDGIADPVEFYKLNPDEVCRL